MLLKKILMHVKQKLHARCIKSGDVICTCMSFLCDNLGLYSIIYTNAGYETSSTCVYRS